MRGAGELTAEASKLLALKAELKAELSDDHGWAPVESVVSLLSALQGSLLHRCTQTEAFQEAPQWVSESPLDEGQSKQGQTRSEPHSGGCRCPLSIPLVRFSAEGRFSAEDRPGPPSSSLPERLAVPQQRP